MVISLLALDAAAAGHVEEGQRLAAALKAKGGYLPAERAQDAEQLLILLAEGAIAGHERREREFRGEQAGVRRVTAPELAFVAALALVIWGCFWLTHHYGELLLLLHRLRLTLRCCIACC